MDNYYIIKYIIQDIINEKNVYIIYHILNHLY